MTQSQGPRSSERRKAERVPFEPLRVRLDKSREGVLIDLSEGGALLVMSMSPPRDNKFRLTIEWKDTHVAVSARVVRSEQRHVQLESATLQRKGLQRRPRVPRHHARHGGRDPADYPALAACTAALSGGVCGGHRTAGSRLRQSLSRRVPSRRLPHDRQQPLHPRRRQTALRTRIRPKHAE